MLSFLARRLVTVVLPTLFGVSLLVFCAMRLIPGDFVDVLLGVGADVPQEQRDRIARSYGLDRPLPVQYVRWLGNAVQGDLGSSLRSGRPVAAEIADRLPVTAELAALATLFSLALAIPAGMLSALRRNGPVDVLARVVALVGLSVPNFLLGTLLILFIALRWPVLPTNGFVPLSDGLWANVRTLILPALSLGALLAASIMRMTRSALLEELAREYLLVARAKGLGGRAVLLGHALRNALIPVVTVVGIQTGAVLGGTVIVEQLFALPGVGRLALDAVLERDYPLVQGTTLFVAAVFVGINLLTDLLYGLIDPRVRDAADA